MKITSRPDQPDQSRSMHCDTLIAGGNVDIGDGNGTRKLDIAINNREIAFLGRRYNGCYKKKISLDDELVCPGFIDVTGHSDEHMIAYPIGVSKLMQGVTLEINGNCGTSAAPNSEPIREQRTRILQEEYGERISFPIWSFEEFANKINGFGTGINRASFVGYNTVRQLAMGMSNSKPTGKELLQMTALIEKALSEGALGLSFGLAFAPGCFSNIDELKKIVQPFKNTDTPLSFHIRDEWSKVDQSVAEVVSVAEHANLPLHISHLKALGGGEDKVRSLLYELNEIRKKGVNVSWDTYFSEWICTSLHVILPPPYNKFKREEVLTLIKRNSERKELVEKLDLKLETIPQFVLFNIGNDKNHKVTIRRAVNQRKSIGNELIGIYKKGNGWMKIMLQAIPDKALENILSDVRTEIGCDCGAVDFPFYTSNSLIHPRAFSSITRFLEWSIEENTPVSLSKAVQRLSSIPADRLKLKGIGKLAVGNAADIVIFNLDSLSSKATIENPHQTSSGLEWAFINGSPVIADGKLIDSKNGRFIRRME